MIGLSNRSDISKLLHKSVVICKSPCSYEVDMHTDRDILIEKATLTHVLGKDKRLHMACDRFAGRNILGMATI